MAKRMTPLPNGTLFANSWKILEHWNCAQSVEHGLGRKNSHYLCINENCGCIYAFENSVVRRWLDLGVEELAKCKSCRISGNKYYSQQNYKVIDKEIDRSPLEIKKGNVYGFLVIDEDTDRPSNLFIDHQRHVACLCNKCGGRHLMRHDDIREGNLPCLGLGKSILEA